jgi:hypothetical protein
VSAKKIGMSNGLVALVAAGGPAAFKRYHTDMAHIADEQLAPHFERCLAAGICPWAAAHEARFRCDRSCGPTHGCRVAAGRRLVP